jgi:hypothetical protein
MTATQKAKYNSQARVHKALAHPTRLFIVEEVSRQERCVSDLSRDAYRFPPSLSSESRRNPRGRKARHAGILPAQDAVRDELLSLRKRGSEGFAEEGSGIGGLTLFLECDLADMLNS